MGFFDCCKDCDHRFLGCHDKCADYQEQKKAHAECKKRLYEETHIPKAKTDYLNNPVWRNKQY